jgi:hypothetical protein
MITENGMKLCDAIMNTLRDGEMMIYNQGVVDGVLKFKQIIDETPDISVHDISEAMQIFLDANTKDGMATENTCLVKEEEKKEEESSENPETSEENVENTEEARPEENNDPNVDPISGLGGFGSLLGAFAGMASNHIKDALTPSEEVTSEAKEVPEEFNEKLVDNFIEN